VKESPSDPAYGRTNWRRFAVSIGVPLAVAAGLVVALEQGAIAASFQVSGQDFKLSADHLHGDGFTQYSDFLPQASGADAQGQKVTAISGIDTAWMTNLCQTVHAPTPFGDVVMRIEAGQGKTEADRVTASHLLIGMSDLQGEADFKDIQIGVADGSLDRDKFDTHGHDPAGFGQQAKTVDIDQLRQTATYTSAGDFKLTHMKLHLYVGSDAAGHECFPDD
jgi:uncharacterized protein DUF6230